MTIRVNEWVMRWLWVVELVACWIFFIMVKEWDWLVMVYQARECFCLDGFWREVYRWMIVWCCVVWWVLYVDSVHLVEIP